MTTIYITTDKDHPEDDIVELVDSLTKVLGKEHIHFTTAIAIHTDDPAIAKIFTTIGRNGIEPPPKKPTLTGTCPDCGKPCTPGCRCNKCSSAIRADKARAALAYQGTKPEPQKETP